MNDVASGTGTNEKAGTGNSEEGQIGRAYQSEIRYRGWKAIPFLIGTYLPFTKSLLVHALPAMLLLFSLSLSLFL